MKRILQNMIVIILVIALTVPVMAVEGVWHNPYGIEDLYEVQPTERYPRDPAAGEVVYIKGTTWPVEPDQSVWITYTRNGVAQQDVGAAWKYNDGNNSYWEAAIGPFEKGDDVVYYVHANQNGQNTKDIGPFSFKVAAWENVQTVSLASSVNGTIVLNAASDSSTFSPQIGISFPTEKTIHMQVAPNGKTAFDSGIVDYTVNDTTNSIEIATSALRVTITKSPYQISVYDIVNDKVLTESIPGGELAWLTDGSKMISGIKDGYVSPENEQFYGFGERYDGIAKRGNIVDTYVYNQYQNQGNKTYLAVPFFYSTRGYGLFLNTTCYSQFDMASTQPDRYTFRAETNGTLDTTMDYYLFAGTPTEVLDSYTDISGKAQAMPKWAFGLWMSANEWDRQSEVTEVVNKANTYKIPANVVVLEQWSDENTFYIFNDSTYHAKSGDKALRYSDFTFSDKWPDPKAMTNMIHDNGMKLLLWQVPVLKHTAYNWEQKDNDEAYMIAQGYAVGDGKGGQYRTPTGTWFGDSLLLDFTNPDAVNWWMSKRAYLFDDVGIDGFKTDGGEMVWGRNTSFSDGRSGAEMRNEYPNTYIKAYHDFAKAKTGTGMTFSRAGTAGVQSTGAIWAGDQTSNFAAFKDALSAGLSAGISGIPFWGWDLAGFTGEFPTAELYKRSTMMAAFAPIMQFHSEKANPAPSEERSPWNVQERTGDNSIIDHFCYYANTRMNILPYIYSEAQKCSDDGTPLMRAMIIDFPEDSNVQSLDEQYMFGRNILVAPIVNEGQTIKQVYLPDGEWIDFFHNALTAGGNTKEYYCDTNSIPVYVRNGSIIPMNMNDAYELGGVIGNNIDEYTNLTFRMYPSGNSNYKLYHSDGTCMDVALTENFGAKTVMATIPAATIPVTLQVFGSDPQSVSVNDTLLSRVDSIASLSKTTQGFYYNPKEKMTYIKLAADTVERSVVLNGISKAPLEAEHANQENVSTNTNHADYYGEGFVDGFAEVGDRVEFSAYRAQSGMAELQIRYSAGKEAGQRTLTVNGISTKVNFPKTADWDTWNIVTIPISTVAGRNRIQISYEIGDYVGINLDCISLS